MGYDAWRGGFCLHFGPFKRDPPRRRVLGGLAEVFLDDRDRIAALESFWDHGGVPLRGLHQNLLSLKSFWKHAGISPCQPIQKFLRPEGSYAVTGPLLRVPYIVLKQNANKLELWFTNSDAGPRSHWTSKYDQRSGLILWFSSRKAQAGWPVPRVGGRPEIALLAGMAIEIERTGLELPITSFDLVPGDFK